MESRCALLLNVLFKAPWLGVSPPSQDDFRDIGHNDKSALPNRSLGFDGRKITLL
ncbi:hypothetical protein [Scytonema sp. PRP1]|uniref:hypothetical protein n=1 Tax=Scytonema sp. PRP1 TaxID=3120513 RepID=UPI00300D113C